MYINITQGVARSLYSSPYKMCFSSSCNQGLMPIGHSDVRDIGSCDIVATWSLFVVTLANPVLFDLDV